MKHVRKNNFAFTTQKLRGLLEVGVVVDKFGNSLFEVVYTNDCGNRYPVYFEMMSSVLDYIKTNFK